MLYQCNIQTLILNTKMTLPQLVGPIDVVSPEHSSGDQSHEFQIASSKNASIEFSTAEYARPTKAELAHCTTSSRLSKYAQSQKLSSLTSQKYRIFPHPLSREASSIHGVVRTDTHTELKLFQPPTSTPKKIRQDQTLPYPQVSMVTRRVTSAEIQKQPKQGPKSVAFLRPPLYMYTSREMILSSRSETQQGHTLQVRQKDQSEASLPFVVSKKQKRFSPSWQTANKWKLQTANHLARPSPKIPGVLPFGSYPKKTETQQLRLARSKQRVHCYPFRLLATYIASIVCGYSCSSNCLSDLVQPSHPL